MLGFQTIVFMCGFDVLICKKKKRNYDSICLSYKSTPPPFFYYYAKSWISFFLKNKQKSTYFVYFCIYQKGHILFAGLLCQSTLESI